MIIFTELSLDNRIEQVRTAIRNTEVQLQDVLINLAVNQRLVETKQFVKKRSNIQGGLEKLQTTRDELIVALESLRSELSALDSLAESGADENE